MALRENNKFILGAGKLYFQEQDENGNLLPGERYLGDTPGFSISNKENTEKLMSSDLAVRQLLIEVKTASEMTAKIECRDITIENIAAFLDGAATTISQTTATVTAEPLGAVKKGLYYQLGQNATTRLGGAKKITAVAIKNGATTYVAGTDYELDAATGRIFIRPTGAIPENAPLTADYSIPATTYDQVLANSKRETLGALRYVADNSSGENRDVYIPMVYMKAEGDLSLKGEKFITLMLICTFLRRGNNNYLAIIDGRGV
jgi:hypothetical protein